MADELRIALIVPYVDVFSGGVERTVKLIEYSPAVGVRYTAFLPRGGIPNPEVARHYRMLEARGLVTLQELGNGHARDAGPFDAVAVPTEYWWQGWKRAKGAGLRGPYCFDFHQLPYIGTLDILKAAPIEAPGMVDFARLPFLQRRIYADGLLLATFQTIASVASVRAFSRMKEGHILATTQVVAGNLEALGYAGPVFVPAVSNAIAREPIEEALREDVALEYDGVYVGRFHPQKGFLDLPRIVARMKDRLGPDVRIAVCGRSHFRRHMARFQDLVRSLGVERNVVLLEGLSRRDLYRTMRQSNMLLYPSYVDGFSLTVLESLCLGVPVVAYDIGALELIWARRAGVFRSPVGDPDALAGTAARLSVGRLEEVRAATTTQAATLLAEYTWERVVRDERTFYERACDGVSRGGG